MVGHVAYILAFGEIIYAESNKVYLDFVMELNFYTILTAVISLLGNIVFWSLLTVYLEQIFPNEWGAKKHPCFCCVGKKPIEPEEEQPET